MTTRVESLDTERKVGDIQAYKVYANKKIFKGSVVLLDHVNGGARTADGTTVLADGDTFVGICLETIDNTDGQLGDEYVRVERNGVHKLLFKTPITNAYLGTPVFCNNTTDDQDVTTDNINGNPQVQVGILSEVVSVNEGRVDITKDTKASTS